MILLFLQQQAKEMVLPFDLQEDQQPEQLLPVPVFLQRLEYVTF